MPTRAELPLQDVTFSESNSWTDALPVCRESAVGSSINQIYREDGNRQVSFQFYVCIDWLQFILEEICLP